LHILPKAKGNPSGIANTIVKKKIFKVTKTPSKSAGIILRKYSQVSTIFYSFLLFIGKKEHLTF
jgi:hypothetical protein